MVLHGIYGCSVVSPPQQIEKMIKNFKTFGNEVAPVDANAQMLQEKLNHLKENNELDMIKLEGDEEEHINLTDLKIIKMLAMS